jgi:hypothetical protein
MSTKQGTTHSVQTTCKHHIHDNNHNHKHKVVVTNAREKYLCLGKSRHSVFKCTETLPTVIE